MLLSKRIEKDYAQIQRRADSMFQASATDIGSMLEAANNDAINSISTILSYNSDVSYAHLTRVRSLDRLRHILEHRYDVCASDIENYWGARRKDFDLLARLSMSFISKKASPPWMRTELNLADKLSKDGRLDPRMGHIRFYLRSMVDAIIKEITRGALEEDPSLHKILKRVRRLFDRKEPRNVREDSTNYNPNSQVNLDQQDEFNLNGTIGISEGTFTMEDVARFQDFQKRAMRWDYREYKPWFSDSLKNNNRYLRDLEQILSSDAIDQLHSGMLEIGSEEMGVKDFAWVLSRPQPVCDECTKRDGLTMTEIKSKMKDQYRDQPPPLHPHCRCQIAPKLKDDWAKNELKKSGMEWDDSTGDVYQAGKQEKKYGITDMTFDQYVSVVRSAGGN